MTQWTPMIDRLLDHADRAVARIMGWWHRRQLHKLTGGLGEAHFNKAFVGFRAEAQRARQSLGRNHPRTRASEEAMEQCAAILKLFKATHRGTHGVS
jgi:hypothetical protein